MGFGWWDREGEGVTCVGIAGIATHCDTGTVHVHINESVFHVIGGTNKLEGKQNKCCA